jgi:hypothetical protein
MKYTTTVTGRAPKVVRCEKCALEFVYLLEVTTSGTGFSPLFLVNSVAESHAQTEAEQKLLDALNSDCAVVPCMACGHIQGYMIPRARADLHAWMGKAAWPSFVVSTVLALQGAYAWNYEWSEALATISLVSAALLGLAAIILPILRRILARDHDPNLAPVEERKRTGQDLSVTKAEYLKMLEPPIPPQPGSTDIKL